jgi:hypothetical protein
MFRYRAYQAIMSNFPSYASIQKNYTFCLINALGTIGRKQHWKYLIYLSTHARNWVHRNTSGASTQFAWLENLASSEYTLPIYLIIVELFLLYPRVTQQISHITFFGLTYRSGNGPYNRLLVWHRFCCLLWVFSARVGSQSCHKSWNCATLMNSVQTHTTHANNSLTSCDIDVASTFSMRTDSSVWNRL